MTHSSTLKVSLYYVGIVRLQIIYVRSPKFHSLINITDEISNLDLKIKNFKVEQLEIEVVMVPVVS